MKVGIQVEGMFGHSLAKLLLCNVEKKTNFLQGMHCFDALYGENMLTIHNKINDLYWLCHF